MKKIEPFFPDEVKLLDVAPSLYVPVITQEAGVHNNIMEIGYFEFRGEEYHFYLPESNYMLDRADLSKGKLLLLDEKLNSLFHNGFQHFKLRYYNGSELVKSTKHEFRSDILREVYNNKSIDKISATLYFWTMPHYESDSITMNFKIID